MNLILDRAHKIFKNYDKDVSGYLNRILSIDFRLNFLQALPFWIASLLVGFIAVGIMQPIMNLADVVSEG